MQRRADERVDAAGRRVLRKTAPRRGVGGGVKKSSDSPPGQHNLAPLRCALSHLLGMQPRRDILPIDLFRIEKPCSLPRLALELDFISDTAEVRTSEPQPSFPSRLARQERGVLVTFVCRPSECPTSTSPTVERPSIGRHRRAVIIRIVAPELLVVICVARP